MLSRIYGTAWLNDKDLKAYLTMLEEAEKRDHRKIAKQQDLFHLQEEAPGLIFWHPKGWSIWQVVEQYMRKVYRDSGYQEVRCPQILDVSLWKKSGHWDNYQDNMFFTESEKRTYALADEPPGPRAGVQPRPAQLPHRPDPLRRVRRLPPQRALRRAARHPARGFTQDDATSLHRGPDRGRGQRLPSQAAVYALRLQ
jgi:threonyl-tRNA synthetase